MRTVEPIESIEQTLAPAPTGDAFDDLWSECCSAVARHPRLKGRSEFSPTIDKASGQIVRHDWKLGEEVTRWITEGNLRSHTEVNIAITKFADHWDRFVRLGVIPSWKLDWRNLVVHLGWFFGVSGKKPLPSKQEFLDEKAEWEKKESERIRQSNKTLREDAAALKKFEEESALEERVEYLVLRIARLLHSTARFDPDEEPLPPECADLISKQKIFEQFTTDFIRMRVSEGRSNTEIEEEIIMDNLDQMATSDIPPLGEGETRRFFDRIGFQRFIRSGGWGKVLDEHDTRLMKVKDDLFVLDIIAKSDQ